MAIAIFLAAPCQAADMPSPKMIECEVQKPHGAREWWAFREIEGKRCWYPGRPGKSKSELFWPKTVKPEPARTKQTITTIKVRPVQEPTQEEPTPPEPEPG